MSNLSRDELACIYSAAILADDDVAVTEDKLRTLLKAASVDVESIWPMLFARALKGTNVREVISQAVMTGGATQPATAGAAAAQQPADTAADTAAAGAKKAPSEDEESDDDMGFGLFD